MSHLWLGHSLAEMGGASGYLYPGCRVSPGDSLWISYPTCSRKTKNQNVKNGRYSGHSWHFDFLFFENRHEAIRGLLGWLRVGLDISLYPPTPGYSLMTVGIEMGGSYHPCIPPGSSFSPAFTFSLLHLRGVGRLK